MRPRQREGDTLIAVLTMLLLTMHGLTDRRDDAGARARACMLAVRAELGDSLVDWLLWGRAPQPGPGG
jgi:hypothetical protein